MTQTTLASTARSIAKWHVVDASSEVLGRMAARVARILMGKHKPIYTPHADTGDFVVVINAADVQLTGRKATAKVYRHHTGYPGGLVTIPYAEVKKRHPTQMVREAVRRMLPKSTMGRHMLSKLKVFPGKDHTHHAQKPEPLSFGTGSKVSG
jgi:large subunit ribosomal protein L13